MAATASDRILLLGGLCWSLITPVVFAQKNGSVEGTVTNSVTHLPIRKASVSLNSPEKNTSYGAITDGSGHFLISNVPPGTYMLFESAQNFLGKGDRMTVADDQHVTGLALALMPFGVIAGKVIDEDGDPIEGADVRVLRYDYSQGERRVAAVGGDQTDDRGEYRLHELPPGRYFVSVSKRDRPIGANVRQAGPELWYAPAYYPAGTDIAQATRVQVTAGGETSGIDFRLARVPAYHIRGRVEGQNRGQVTAQPCDQPGGVQSVSGNAAKFDLGPLAAGTYCLALRGADVVIDQTVTLTNDSVNDLVLSPPQFQDLQGRVVSETDVGQIVLRKLNGQSAASITGGEFTIKAAPPGKYAVTLPGLPDGSYIQAIQLGSQDVSDGPVTLRGGDGPLVVRVASDTGQISGSVANAMAGAVVSVVPAGRLAQRRDLQKLARTDENGEFHVTGVAPGEYKVYAWEHFDPSIMVADEFRAEFSGSGTPATVRSGGEERVQLKLIPDGQIEQVKNRL